MSSSRAIPEIDRIVPLVLVWFKDGSHTICTHDQAFRLAFGYSSKRTAPYCEFRKMRRV